MRESVWQNSRTSIETQLNSIQIILDDEKFIEVINNKITEEERNVMNVFFSIINELKELVSPDNEAYKFIPQAAINNVSTNLANIISWTTSINTNPDNINNTTSQIQNIENHMLSFRVSLNPYSNISQNIEKELKNKNKKIEELEKLLEQKNKGWETRLDESNKEIECLINDVREVHAEAKKLTEDSGTLHKTHNFSELADSNQTSANICLFFFVIILSTSIVAVAALLFKEIHDYYWLSIPITGFLTYLSILEKRYRGKYFKYKDLATSINALPSYLSNITDEKDINAKDKLKLKMAEFFFTKVHNDTKFKEKDMIDLIDAFRGTKTNG